MLKSVELCQMSYAPEIWPTVDIVGRRQSRLPLPHPQILPSSHRVIPAKARTSVDAIIGQTQSRRAGRRAASPQCPYAPSANGDSRFRRNEQRVEMALRPQARDLKSAEPGHHAVDKGKGCGEPFAALSPRSAHSPQSTAGSNPRWPSIVAGRNTQVWPPATPAAITTCCVVK